MYLNKSCSTYGYSCICISPVVPTGTPVSDKFRLCISSVVPTGTSASDKSRLCISSVTPTGVLDKHKSVKYKFCNSYGSPE